MDTVSLRAASYHGVPGELPFCRCISCEDATLEEFDNKVAVITGAASGIGRALAERCAGLGMQLALADLNHGALAEVAAALEGRGARVRHTALDVSDAAAMTGFAERCFADFGHVDLLFNNAGILRLGSIWEHAADEWETMLSVNIMGVANGLNAFVPRLIAGGAPAHIVNTGSVGSLVVAPGMGQYGATKMAVRAITESLAYDLAAIGADIDVSLLCPGPVITSIGDSLQTEDGGGMEEVNENLKVGPEFIAPETCAAIVIEGIRQRRFWIFTHPFSRYYRNKTDAVLSGLYPEYEQVQFDEVPVAT